MVRICDKFSNFYKIQIQPPTRYTNNRSNSYVEDGNLHIAPTLVADEFGEAFLSSGTINLYGGAPADTCTNNVNWGCERTGYVNNYLNPIKSARLRTVKSFAFKYGIMETRVKLPAGDWLWPAVWLMPKVNAYSQWPSSGEIDLLEGRGNRDLFDYTDRHMGTNHVASTMHFGPAWNLNGFETTNFGYSSVNTNFADDFHVYRLGWTNETIQFSVDNIILGTINATADGGFWNRGRFDERSPNRENPWKRATIMAPFDQEFYVIMNLAVGGVNGYFSDTHTNAEGTVTKPWRNDSPQAFKDFWLAKNQWLPSWNLNTDSSHLQVDYVKIFAV